MPKFAITSAHEYAGSSGYRSFRFGNNRYSLYEEGGCFVILDREAGVKMRTNAATPSYSTPNRSVIATKDHAFYLSDWVFSKLTSAYRLPGAPNAYKKATLLDDAVLTGMVEKYRNENPKLWDDSTAKTNKVRLTRALREVRYNRQFAVGVFALVFAAGTLFVSVAESGRLGAGRDSQPPPAGAFSLIFGGE